MDTEKMLIDRIPHNALYVGFEGKESEVDQDYTG